MKIIFKWGSIILATIGTIFSVAVFFDRPGFSKFYFAYSLPFASPIVFYLFFTAFNKLTSNKVKMGEKFNYFLLPIIIGLLCLLYQIAIITKNGYETIHFRAMDGDLTDGQFFNKSLGIYGLLLIFISFVTLSLNLRKDSANILVASFCMVSYLLFALMLYCMPHCYSNFNG